jgi:hypothetical protein
MHQGLDLFSSLKADEGMQLINHDVLDVGHHPRDGWPPIHKEGFQGFRGDQQHPIGTLQELLLLAVGDITMPASNRDLQRVTELVEPSPLIIDQRFERTDV